MPHHIDWSWVFGEFMAKKAVQLDISPPLTIGERVLLVRLVRGMTQAYVAGQLGCHQVRISQLELANGLSGLYFDKFVELVQLLDTTSDFILGLSNALYLDKDDLQRFRDVLGFVQERRLHEDVRWSAYCRRRSLAPELRYTGRQLRPVAQAAGSW